MKKERNVSIDRFRGFIIFSMIFFQLLEHFNNLGIFTKISIHAADCFPKTAEVIAKGFNGIYLLPNMTIADIIAPAFLLAIGLTFIPSYNRKKEKYGKKKALLEVINRYLILTGIGVMMSSINVALDGSLNNGFIDAVDYLILGLTALFLVLGLVWTIFKKKKIGKTLGSILKYIVTVLGILGVVIALINAILLCLGLTEETFGYWLVLQHIGLAGIFAVLIMHFSKENSTKYRAVAGIAILVLFTIFHETTLPTLFNNLTITNNMQLVDKIADGGFIGGIAYAGLLLIFTAFADLYYKDKNKFKKYTLGLLIPVILLVSYAAVTFHQWDGSNKLLTAGLSDHLSINKGSISPSYLVISLFVCLVMFMIIDLFKNKKLKFDFLDIWGRSPILMYILEFGLIGGVTQLLPDSLIANAPVPLAIFEVMLLTGVLTFIAYRLYKKGSVIKI